MIKVVLIDDERPALRDLEHRLKDYHEFEIADMFINPLKAIEKIGDIKPQVVFLDINMPQLQGIDAASRILDLCPDTDIVFITAYDQYAVEAFELHALDYVLKPISQERFAKTLRRVIKKKGIKQYSSEKRLNIKCFGRFQIGWFGEEPIKWRTEKTKELFAFLLHHQGRKVPKEEIIDKLWSEVEIEKAVHQLHNGIYYIRKTLEQHGVERSLVSISGNYCLKIGAVDVDILLFCERLIRFKNNPTIKDMETVEALYSGDYFEGADWLWADLERERLARQYREVVVCLCQAYINIKEFDRAEELLIKVFNRNPYEERFTNILLNVYKMTGNKAKAVKHFMKYAKIIQKELGVKPQESIQKIYASIK